MRLVDAADRLRNRRVGATLSVVCPASIVAILPAGMSLPDTYVRDDGVLRDLLGLHARTAHRLVSQ